MHRLRTREPTVNSEPTAWALDSSRFIPGSQGVAPDLWTDRSSGAEPSWPLRPGGRPASRPCDHFSREATASTAFSQLTPDVHNRPAATPSATALAIAEHKRNYEACRDGYGHCDRTRLTPLETQTVPPQSLRQ